MLGFWSSAQIYVAADATRMGVSPLSTIGLFLADLDRRLGHSLFGDQENTSRRFRVGVIAAVVTILAFWLFVHYAPIEQDNNRVHSIGIGGEVGIVMMFNVWGIISAQTTRKSFRGPWLARLQQMRR